MSTVNSLFKDPSVNFVWWIEGDKIAIATTGGDGGTTLTAKGNYKAPIIGTTSSFQADGETRNLLAEDLDSSETTVTVDYGAAFVVGDILLIDSEKMLITAISSNDLTVTRGHRNTTAAEHDDDSPLSTTNVLVQGMLISYYAEPDKLTSITGTIDIDNTLQPALIAYVKAKALMDAAARTNSPELASIKMQSAQLAMAEYREMVIRYGARRRDKTGGTRGIVPTNLT